MDFKIIGKRIAQQRKRQNLTQAAFSEALGVSEGYVSRMECGTTKISLQRIKSVAEVLNTDIGLLVSDQVILPEMPINRDVCELIKDWSSNEIEGLIAHLECSNRLRNSPKK